MSWPIMEVKKNDDPFEDPWERARDAKKDRVEKNANNRMRNAEKAGELERGTSRRIMKAKTKARADGRVGSRLDMKNFENVPSGIPMDMANEQRGKAKTKLALLATQRSTASMGKFDQMRDSEPERKKAMAGLKKRKFVSGTSKEVVKTEAKNSMKVLENVITGGGKSKERAIRRGEHAKGETGYDYDYNDGGYSGYKKKKGRAGIGKMSKVTKKMSR
jgi:regulator of ribosome biosynthesis